MSRLSAMRSILFECVACKALCIAQKLFFAVRQRDLLSPLRYFNATQMQLKTLNYTHGSAR